MLFQILYTLKPFVITSQSQDFNCLIIGKTFLTDPSSFQKTLSQLWARYGWQYFSLICVIKTRYGFTNISEIQDLKRAYPLLDMVDRETRYDNAHVCIVLVQFYNYLLIKAFYLWFSNRVAGFYLSVNMLILYYYATWLHVALINFLSSQKWDQSQLLGRVSCTRFPIVSVSCFLHVEFWLVLWAFCAFRDWLIEW